MEEQSENWEAPPLPENAPVPEPPQMSEAATLFNIFVDPGATFEDLKRKPRFIMAAVMIALLTFAFSFGMSVKVGETGLKRFIEQQLEKNPQTASLDADAKQRAIGLQMTIMKVTRYLVPIFVLIALVIGGLFYFAGGKAFGGRAGFMESLSVFVYSSLPPTVLSMIANIIVLAIKSVDDIDFAAAQRGLVKANALMFWDGAGMPVVATLVSVIDLFAIWGWILAAIGLRIMNKISSSSAWAITLIIALIGITFRVLGAVMSGNPS